MKDTLLTFPKGGVHPPGSKALSEHLAIETLPIPEEVDVPLVQHFGAPCKPLVEKKDKVSEGDLIGEVEGGLGASIHASVTGTVKSLGSAASAASVITPAITIQTDRRRNPESTPPPTGKPCPGKSCFRGSKRPGLWGLGARVSQPM